MFTFNLLVIKFIILIAIILFAYTMGWLFTIKYRIAEINTFFQFKAFECQKCLTFHISWILTCIISLCFMDFWMLGWGIFLCFGFFFLMYLDEKERFVE